jgi:phosphopantothenoylcysteine synthetase/decarboxylase
VAGFCTLILTGAPLTARGADLARALVDAGWEVRVVATPAAVPWVDAEAITSVTGVPPRVEARDPAQPKSPRPDVVVVAPATFNTVNKLAHGIADTYAHSTACEAIGAGARVVVVPMVNNLLWGHPALAASIRVLEAAGVRLLDIQTGSDTLQAVMSGTGPDVVTGFDPSWIARVVGQPATNS